MRSSSAVSITRPRPLALREKWLSVEYSNSIEQGKLEFGDVIHHARMGTRPPCLAQLSKDIAGGQNQLVRTLVRFDYGMQDIGVPIEAIANPLENHLARLRSRDPDYRPRNVKELLAIETEIESEINPIQWEFASDTRNGFLRRLLIEKIRRAIANMQELLASLEKEEADQISGRKPQ